MLDQALAALAVSPLAAALKASQYVYPVVNAIHILGLATVFGAILALDLRLLGLARRVPLPPLAVHLPPIAATGLAVAVLSGSLLFSVDPVAYAANRAFLAKVTLVAIGAAHALAVHASPSWRRLVDGDAVAARRLRASAAFSMAVWTGAIFCGRFIAF